MRFLPIFTKFLPTLIVHPAPLKLDMINVVQIRMGQPKKLGLSWVISIPWIRSKIPIGQVKKSASKPGQPTIFLRVI